jgi:hypothetical protein
VLARELEADAGSSVRHSLLPAVHAAGPNTLLATYLLPEMGKRIEILIELGLPMVVWLAARNNLSNIARKDGVAEPPGPRNGVAFARVFRPSPQMVSLAPSTCCV